MLAFSFKPGTVEARGGNLDQRQVNALEIGRLLRRVRKDANLTLAQAAKAINRRPKRLWRVEAKGAPLPCKDLAALLKLYGASSENVIKLLLFPLPYSGSKDGDQPQRE